MRPGPHISLKCSAVGSPPPQVIRFYVRDLTWKWNGNSGASIFLGLGTFGKSGGASGNYDRIWELCVLGAIVLKEDDDH